MKYKALIFDLDGVLLSTDRYHYLAWKQLTAEIGVPFDEVIGSRLRGVGRMESLEIILASYKTRATETEKRSWAERKNTYYRRYLERLSPDDVSEEVTQTLRRLRAAGFQMAVGSSSRNAKFILEATGLGGFFDAVSDGTSITRAKPDPEVFLKAAEFLAAAPAACLVVEDAEAGILAATAAGMDSAAIGDGAKEAPATYRLNTLSDLLAIVLPS